MSYLAVVLVLWLFAFCFDVVLLCFVCCCCFFGRGGGAEGLVFCLFSGLFVVFAVSPYRDHKTLARACLIGP